MKKSVILHNSSRQIVSNVRIEGAAMYAKFPYYSIALMYAVNLSLPVSIMIGDDNLFWVVDRQLTDNYLDKGGLLLHSMN